MKVAAYIPIKMNNVRLPGKNTKELLDGTPMCKLLFRTLEKVNNIDEKYCFCSNENITSYLTDGITYLHRSESLDSSDTRCDEIIQSFIEIVNPDIIVLTHATSPFLNSKTIETCVEKVKSGEFDSAFTVAPMQEFIWKDGKPLNFDAAHTPKSQDLPIWHRETNGVFVFTREVFEKTNRRVGITPYLCEINFPENVDVNYPEDFLIVNAVYSSNL